MTDSFPTIDVEHDEYLDGLRIDEKDKVVRVYSMDGAGLYRITDDHYVIVECQSCKHNGRALLERVLPREWERFHTVVNPTEGFACHHYGPV